MTLRWLFAWDTHIILEGDNATIYNGICNYAKVLTPTFLLFDRINALKTSFVGFKCNLVGRNSNTVAHLVARCNLDMMGDFIFTHPFLQSLVTLVNLDSIYCPYSLQKKKKKKKPELEIQFY